MELDGYHAKFESINFIAALSLNTRVLSINSCIKIKSSSSKCRILEGYSKSAKKQGYILGLHVSMSNYVKHLKLHSNKHAHSHGP